MSYVGPCVLACRLYRFTEIVYHLVKLMNVAPLCLNIITNRIRLNIVVYICKYVLGYHEHVSHYLFNEWPSELNCTAYTADLLTDQNENKD